LEGILVVEKTHAIPQNYGALLAEEGGRINALIGNFENG